MPASHRPNLASLSALLSATLFIGVGAATAQTTITSLNTFTSAGTASSQTVTGANSSGFSTTTNYTVNYAGNTLGINSFTTGAGATLQTYNPIFLNGQTTFQRNTANTTPSNNILWSRNSATPGTGNNINAAAPFTGQQTTAFGGGNLNLNVGTDNLFSNTGNSSGNNNNVERVDFVFNSAVTVNSGLSFALFERGTTTGHDGFKIAAVLAVDANGKPSQYGSLLSVGAGSWGTVSLGALDTTVFRNNATEAGADATHPSSTTSGQVLGGVAMNIVHDLGVVDGTKILGYSLFASDTNAATSADLLDITNTNVYPTNTLESAGGLDLAAYNGVLYQTAVPEPSTWAALLVGAGLLGVATLNRRRAA